MLEKAKEVTREGEYTRVECARFAEDLAVLVGGHAKQERLYGAVNKRLREELGKLHVAGDDMRGEQLIPGRMDGVVIVYNEHGLTDSDVDLTGV